jgi:hypothetical protein
MGLTEAAGRYPMEIIVYLSKAYEVFKEIFLAPAKLLEPIRLKFRGLAAEYLTLMGREINHPFGVPEGRMLLG